MLWYRDTGTGATPTNQFQTAAELLPALAGRPARVGFPADADNVIGVKLRSAITRAGLAANDFTAAVMQHSDQDNSLQRV